MAKKKTKAKPTKTKAKPKGKAVKPAGINLAAALPKLTLPASGAAYDMAGADPAVITVTVTGVIAATYSDVCACVFDPGDDVTTPDDDDDYYQYTDLGLPAAPGTTYTNVVPVENVNAAAAPGMNNNKVVVWALNIEADDDGQPNDTWDPICIVYFKVFDSTQQNEF